MRVRINTTGAKATYDVVLINSKTKPNDLIAKTANTALNQVVKFLQKAIIELNEAKSNPAPQNQITSVSVADELTKMKSLLDAGVLTQEEFDAQKKKVIGVKPKRRIYQLRQMRQ